MTSAIPISRHVLLAATAAVVAFVAACRFAEPVSASLAALLFVALTVFEAFKAKSQAVKLRETAADPDLGTLSNLLALVYAWGGTSLVLTYLISGLRWQHGWQYGLGMLLIAAAIWLVSRKIAVLPAGPAKAGAERVSVRLAMVHTLAAMIALAWLVASGKLATAKDDWAANIIFMAGGTAAATVSLLLTRAYAETRT